MSLDILLGAALETSLSLLAEAGLGDAVRDLRERWFRTDERQRRAALDKAISAAAAPLGDQALQSLLDHRPFQEEIVGALLDPEQVFDVEAAVEVFGSRFPEHKTGLRRFFKVLESNLLLDPLWGPILERMHEFRDRPDVQTALQEHGLALPTRTVVNRLKARLDGSGALAQGAGAFAASHGAIGVGGNVQQIIQLVIQELTLGAVSDDQTATLRRRYLREVATDCDLLPWSRVSKEHADPTRGVNLRLADVYTDLGTTELRHMEREEDLRRFLARRDAPRVSAQEMINGANRLLIMGDPGSGKSTLLRHLAFTLAQASLAADPAPWLARLKPWQWGVCLPVRIELRHLSSHAAGQPSAAPAQVMLDYLHSL